MNKFCIANVGDPDKATDHLFHHKVLTDGMIRTYPTPTDKDTVWIYIEGDKPNPNQCFATFCLIMSPGYSEDRGLKEPEIVGDFTTWEEIVAGAKR